MSYSAGQYNTRFMSMFADPDVATGTTTASGSNNLTTSFAFPTFARKTVVNKVKVVVKTAPATNLTVLTLSFLNGTDTFATATVGTNAAGAVVDGTVTASLSTFALGSAPTVTVVGTGTASGMSYGAYEVFFETQERP